LKKFLGALALALAFISPAAANPIIIPGDRNQRLIANNLYLTTDSLFAAYMSENLEQRRLAEMYVIGVIASSEGESWCGFKIASPDAVQEQVYIGLKSASEKLPKSRPAAAIQSRLKEILPCKK
jgi:hypothetical protein